MTIIICWGFGYGKWSINKSVSIPCIYTLFGLWLNILLYYVTWNGLVNIVVEFIESHPVNGASYSISVAIDKRTQTIWTNTVYLYAEALQLKLYRCMNMFSDATCYLTNKSYSMLRL